MEVVLPLEEILADFLWNLFTEAVTLYTMYILGKEGRKLAKEEKVKRRASSKLHSLTPRK